MFEKIISSSIQTTASAPISDTGYLDMMPWTGPVKGTDEHGRPFFALPLETVQERRIRTGGQVFKHITVGMVCFFQRYSNDSGLWVTAESHVAGEPAAPIPNGAIRNPDNGRVEDLLLKVLNGETVEFFYKSTWKDDVDCFMRFTTRMLTPVEIEMARAKDLPENGCLGGMLPIEASDR